MKHSLLFLPFLLVFTTFILSEKSFAQMLSITDTYSTGDIPTSFQNYSATCNGPSSVLTITLPAGGPWLVTSVDISYDMTASNGAWLSEQMSKIHCQNNNNSETNFIPGPNTNTEGTHTYNRTDLDIANGQYSAGTDLKFEMRAFRTWEGSQGCLTTNNRIDDGTWIITVNYESSTPMTYASSTTTQSNTSDIVTCSSNQEIIGIEIVTNGSTSPIDVTNFKLRTNGSTNPGIVSNVDNIHVYYTGTSSIFSPINLFGTESPLAPSTAINVGGIQTLASGTNYF